MSTEMPSKSELYEQARQIDNEIIENEETESVSNFFAWDLEPNRFYGSGNIPDEIVVLPNVYTAFIDGKGFRVDTPLHDNQDRDDAEQILGDEWIDYSGPKVDAYDTPSEIMKMHYLADNLGVDSFRLSADTPIPANVSTDELLDPEYERAFDRFVSEYTRPANARFVPEAIEEFKGNGKRTAFVTYASRDDDFYTEDPIDAINDANEGGMAYHTPFTLNRVLSGSLSS